jgi:RNA polymerase sigma-70 factor, ECF subfamily
MTSHATDMPLSFVAAKDALAGPETDAFLLGRLRDGDAAAGEKLVLRYHEPLIRYLYRLSGKMSIADDLHQQAWLSVMEHIDQFDATIASGGFKAWLFRIATNKANDLWRSGKRQRTAYDGAMRIAPTESPQAGDRAETTEEAEKLRECIAKLPEQQRQVLLLRYYSGLKFVEIAETLGCPLNTALGRMHKAMQKLKEMME